MSNELFNFLAKKPHLSELITDDLTCILCQNLMINAHVTCCGCEFCESCIYNYLRETDKFCPGNLDECNIRPINFVNDVHVSPATNRKIKNLKVSCLNDACNFEDSIIKMIDHIKVCDFNKNHCPYFEMGCIEDEFSRSDLENHMTTELSNHNNLIVHLTNEIKIDTKNLKNQQENTNNQINQFQINFNNDKSNIFKIQEQLEMSLSKMKQLEMEINEMKLENRQLSEGFAKINEINEQIKTENRSFRVENDELRSELQKLSVCVADIPNKIEVRCEDSEKKNREQCGQLQRIIADDIGFIETDLLNKIEEIRNQSADKEIKIWKELEQFSQFDWIIDEIDTKRMSNKGDIEPVELYSPNFYRYNYKLQIFTNLDGFDIGKGSHLSVYFRILKGEFDDQLAWPCKLKIKLSLVNQLTKKGEYEKEYSWATISDNNKCVFDKPITYTNRGWGHHQFISHEALDSSNYLMKNDTIIIRCIALMT